MILFDFSIAIFLILRNKNDKANILTVNGPRKTEIFESIPGKVIHKVVAIKIGKNLFIAINQPYII